MFDWFKNSFGRREYPTWKDVPAWNKVNDDMDKVANDMSKVIPFPELKTVPEPAAEEHYRVGFTSDGSTTLTLLTSTGTSMTLTMDRAGCEQLIKMLRASYLDEE